MSQVVWVTGVAGFTGRHLVAYLKEKLPALSVTGIDVQPLSPGGVDSYHQIDLREVAGLSVLLGSERPDVVIHLAGLMPPKSEADMWLVNAGGTLNLLQALGQAGCSPRFVCIGSAAEYLPVESGAVGEDSFGPGYTPYGRVKWGQSMLALKLGKQLGIDVMIARPFNLIGPGLPNTLVAAQFCEQFARDDNQPIKVGNTTSARDFVDIRDAVNAYWQIACHGQAGEIYNVCTGIPTRISMLLDQFSELSGGGHEILVDESRLKAVDANSVYGSFDKLHAISSWQPSISLKSSLTDMFNELAL